MERKKIFPTHDETCELCYDKNHKNKQKGNVLFNITIFVFMHLTVYNTV